MDGSMIWNPWHGCHKKSPGCLHCYMFRTDALYEKDSTEVKKTKDFSLAIKKHRDGSYVIPKGEIVYTCMTSDFFIEEADEWRKEIWQMIKVRKDVQFYIITKRIERFFISLPEDWGKGYPNVTICATCENQQMVDERLPLLLEYPICHREIIHEPMLEDINIEPYLATGKILSVTCGGESGNEARECHYEWILHTREQCKKYKVSFYFKQTGARFVKDGKTYFVPRKKQLSQAQKANINLW